MPAVPSFNDRCRVYVEGGSRLDSRRALATSCRRISRLVRICTVLLCIAPSGRAALLVGNLDADADPIHFVGFGNATVEAVAFTTSTTEATLTKATADLIASEGTTFFAQVWLSSGGVPGSVYASLTNVTLQSGGRFLVDFSTSGILLQAQTSYWLVVGTTSGGANWSVNQTNDQSSPLGWTIDSRTQSNDGALTWLRSRTDSPLRVSLSGVPEPSTVVLTLIALLIGGIGYSAKW